MDADKIADIINTHRMKISLTLLGKVNVMPEEWLNVEKVIQAFADELEGETCKCWTGTDEHQDWCPIFDREAFKTTARGPQPEPKSPIAQPPKPSGLILLGGSNGH